MIFFPIQMKCNKFGKTGKISQIRKGRNVLQFYKQIHSVDRIRKTSLHRIHSEFSETPDLLICLGHWEDTPQ